MDTQYLLISNYGKVLHAVSPADNIIGWTNGLYLADDGKALHKREFCQNQELRSWNTPITLLRQLSVEAFIPVPRLYAVDMIR